MPVVAVFSFARCSAQSMCFFEKLTFERVTSKKSNALRQEALRHASLSSLRLCRFVKLALSAACIQTFRV